MSASVRAATSGPAANRNREAWPASPGPGAPSWSCCPARWEAPAGATACSRRERPSLFRALHATNASRQVSGASSPMSAASTATLRTAVIRAYGHRAEPRGLQSAQPCVYGGLGEARQRLKPEPLGGVRRAPDCPPAVQSGKNPAANIKSFMFSPLLSALVNITSIMKEHQAKPHGNLGPSLRRVKLGG